MREFEVSSDETKSYHDRGTTPRQYEVGNYVYVKVSPTKVCKGLVLKES
jgi:hypothetical protein